MQALGYHLTWKTRCFINGGCGEEVIAHTNGHGDFVLFDELGYPWPIHPCYLERLSIRGEIPSAIDISKTLDIDAPYVEQGGVEEVHVIGPDIRTPEPHYIMGEITDVSDNILNIYSESLHLSPSGRNEFMQASGNRNCMLSIVTDDGKRYNALADSRNTKFELYDMISGRIRARSIFNEPFFLLSKIRLFHYVGRRP